MANIEYIGAKSERVVGTQSADTISALHFAADDGGIEPFTQGSNDTIFGLGGSDRVSAGDDNDLVFGGSGNDTLQGETGNDTMFGGTGNDRLFGLEGNDVLAVETGFGNFGTDTLSGGSGFDIVNFRTGTVIEVNGSPSSFSTPDASHGVSVNLVNQFRPGAVGDFSLIDDEETGEVLAFVTSERGRILDQSGTGLFADIEQFDLTNSADLFLDSSAGHIINGRGGNDTISGGGGIDIIDGGTGSDTVLYRGSSAAVSISLLDFGNGGSGSGGDAEKDTFFSIENVHGSNHNDFTLGNASANEFRGFLGNDTLLGGNGNDTLSGQDGDDVLRGGNGNDQVNGGSGTDTALFLDWDNAEGRLAGFVRGRIELANGDDQGEAVLTSTLLTSITGSRTVDAERDTLTGIENVTASNISETIIGNNDANILKGRGGNDVIDGGRGNDTMDGGDGQDTLSYASLPQLLLQRLAVSLEDGTATATRTIISGFTRIDITETDTFTGFEHLSGSRNSDTLIGNALANRISGDAGNDTLAGLAGADTLNGGDGNDTADYSRSQAGLSIDLGRGQAAGGDADGDVLQQVENLLGSRLADALAGNSAANRIEGSEGDDTIAGTNGADTMDGGDDTDTLSYADAGAVTISLDSTLVAAGDAAGHLVFNFENLSGSAFDDQLRGDEAANIISGDAGNDTLDGAGGADTLDGGDGLDIADYRLDAAVNIDFASALFAGAALDDAWISIEGVFGSDTAADIIKGDASDNRFDGFGGDDQLLGRAGNDTLNGGAGEDTVQGGAGTDQMAGGLNADLLQGNADDDTIAGGGGRDTINGGSGNDQLTGGGGGDIFVFAGQNSGQDVITDWVNGTDKIKFDTALVDSFADLTITNNTTNAVTIGFGGNTIVVQSSEVFKLSAEDFIF